MYHIRPFTFFQQFDNSLWLRLYALSWSALMKVLSEGSGCIVCIYFISFAQEEEAPAVPKRKQAIVMSQGMKTLTVFYIDYCNVILELFSLFSTMLTSPPLLLCWIFSKKTRVIRLNSSSSFFLNFTSIGVLFLCQCIMLGISKCCLDMSVQDVEEAGIPVVPRVMTPWHSVLCFKSKKDFGSLIIWNPSRATYIYPFHKSELQPGSG